MAFIEGNIVRIYMKDFLTFDEMELCPKPHLNVIIGPNGTGKSTIMCGLALVLSNKTTVTGRGKEVSEYVKHGKEMAVIEVEIFRGQSHKGGNLVVRREFNKANANQFYLQGQSVSFKEVDSNLKKLGIQVDNLCQFLPQDRVVEFAKMNSMQLLENTEKTVGGQQLYNQHMQLCSRGGDLQQLRQRQQQIREQHQTEVDKNQRVDAEVQNHHKRAQLQREIEKLQQRRLWFLYTKLRVDHIERKKKKEALVAELKALKDRWQPDVDRITAVKNDSEDMKKKILIEERVVSNISSEATSLESRLNDFVEQRQDAVRDYENKEKVHHQQQRQLQDLHKQLATIESQIEALDEQEGKIGVMDEETLTRAINELTLEGQGLSRRLAGVQEEALEVQDTRRNHLATARDLKQRIDNLNDTSQRRLQLLQQRHRDAYQAAIWLQQNTNRFKDVVYPPICTLLNVLSPEYAQYVEDRVPRADLIAFVCRDKDDVNLLKRFTDEKRWTINIVHSGSDDLSQFRPDKPEHYIKNLGFDTYLLQTIEGPGAVLHYLCKTYKLHNIPVALGDKVNVQRVLKDFMSFYIADSRYTQSRSRYSNDVMTNLSQVQKPMLLTQNLQHDRLNALNEQLRQLQQEINSKEERLKCLHASETELSRAIEEKRRQKQQMLQQRNNRKTLLARRDHKQEQINRTAQDQVNLADALALKEHKMQLASRDALKAAEGLCELRQRHCSAKHNLVIMRAYYKYQCDSVTELTNAFQEMEETVALKKQEVNDATMRVRESMRSGQDTLAELLRSLGLEKPTEIDEEVRSRFNAGIQGLEATEEELNKIEAHRDCLVTADSQVVAEFNQRKKNIENLALQLEKLTTEEQRGTSDLMAMRAEWLNSINKLTETISASFSRLMARMKCAGEVKLSTPDNEDDLSKYGLTIWVRFRGSEKLRELTAMQQSGGERAVSTALYLLALQTMSTVPFRCADEINQGMDAENERQMITMLVEHMTDLNASQYFLVTPKLLPNFPYNDRVNVICVINGPKVACKIPVEAAIKRKKKLNSKGK